MVPVQRMTRTQGRNRRSHNAMRKASAVHCPNCGAWKRSHTACPACGFVPPRSSRQAGFFIKPDQEEA